jgi:hypothetical protein
MMFALIVLNAQGDQDGAIITPNPDYHPLPLRARCGKASLRNPIPVSASLPHTDP